MATPRKLGADDYKRHLTSAEQWRIRAVADAGEIVNGQHAEKTNWGLLARIIFYLSQQAENHKELAKIGREAEEARNARSNKRRAS